MRNLKVFNQVSLDGYFTDDSGDMSWAHKNQDAEWGKFVSENSSGGGLLVFGRVTYQMMESYWPTPQALKDNAELAERMNSQQKVVFSRTLDKATWNNTTLIKGNLESEIDRLKRAPGPPLVLMGSGTLVAQLTKAGLIDEYQIVLHPTVLGSGRTMFEGVDRKSMALKKSRAFSNGNTVLWYEPAKK